MQNPKILTQNFTNFIQHGVTTILHYIYKSYFWNNKVWKSTEPTIIKTQKNIKAIILNIYIFLNLIISYCGCRTLQWKLPHLQKMSNHHPIIIHSQMPSNEEEFFLSVLFSSMQFFRLYWNSRLMYLCSQFQFISKHSNPKPLCIIHTWILK